MSALSYKYLCNEISDLYENWNLSAYDCKELTKFHKDHCDQGVAGIDVMRVGGGWLGGFWSGTTKEGLTCMHCVLFWIAIFSFMIINILHNN